MDIVEHANNVIEFTNGLSYEAFVADSRVYYAVMKNVTAVNATR